MCLLLKEPAKLFLFYLQFLSLQFSSASSKKLKSINNPILIISKLLKGVGSLKITPIWPNQQKLKEIKAQLLYFSVHKSKTYALQDPKPPQK